MFCPVEELIVYSSEITSCEADDIPFLISNSSCVEEVPERRLGSFRTFALHIQNQEFIGSNPD